MPETIAPIFTIDPAVWAQLQAPVSELMTLLDPIAQWNVLGRADHRLTQVPEAAFDLHQHLAQLPQLHRGSAVLKADSPRFGAFTIERNGRAPLLLWVRMHEAGSHWEFGNLGRVLQVGYQSEDLFIADQVDAAITVVRKILKDPDVQLRGGVFPAEQDH